MLNARSAPAETSPVLAAMPTRPGTATTQSMDEHQAWSSRNIAGWLLTEGCAGEGLGRAFTFFWVSDSDSIEAGRTLTTLMLFETFAAVRRVGGCVGGSWPSDDDEECATGGPVSSTGFGFQIGVLVSVLVRKSPWRPRMSQCLASL